MGVLGGLIVNMGGWVMHKVGVGYSSVSRVGCTDEFNIALAVDQHMLWLQIAIGNAMFV